MTAQEFVKVIEEHDFKEKLESTLNGLYPDHKVQSADMVAAKVFRAFRSVEKFANGGHLWEWLETACKRGMDDAIRKAKGRRKAYRTMRIVTPRKYDPYHKIDYKVDLERAICAVVPAGPMRAAMWHHTYEGYTAEECINMLPVGVRAARTWERHFQDAKRALNAEMKRKHYRGV